MNPSPQKAGSGRVAAGLPARLALLIFAVQPLFADTKIPADRSNEALTNIVVAKEDSRIDSIANNGSGAVSSTLQNNGANISIKEDDTLSYLLKEGDSTFVIALPKSALLDRFTFINENAGAQGDLRIAVSNYRLPAESPKWNTVDGSVHFAHKRLFNLSMLGVEAKYVRLSFHVENAGRISALGLHGTETPGRFPRESHVLHISSPIPTGSGNDGLTFGLADLSARSRVLYISSGSSNFARRMIDENPETAFHFSPTDLHPTVVVELGTEERSHRVTVLYKTGCGHLDAFLLKNYKPSPGPVDFTGLKAVATISERSGNDRTAMTFDPENAPFVALRWTPDFSRCGPQAFEVAEIGAFDDATLAMTDPEELASAPTSLSGYPPGEIPIVPAPSP